MRNSAAGVIVGVFISLQLPVVGLAQQSTPTPKWSVTEGMDSPESVYYEPVSGFVFSSQIGGDAAAKDGNGRIVKLTVDGKVVDTHWSKATLNAPKGLRSAGGTLFVVDIDEVVGFEIASGREVSRVKTDAKFLNDMAVAADGTIYATDSFGNRVYVVKDGKASVLIESPKLEMPNGILFDGNRVIVATDGRPGQGGTPGSLWSVNVTSKEIKQITTKPIGTPDGVEFDGTGGYIVADVGGGRIFDVDPEGNVRQLLTLDREPADISYISSKKLLLVPHLGLNRVSAYDLPYEP